jgi:hypothetical protein
MEARTFSVLRRRVGVVKGVSNSGGGPVAGGDTTPSACSLDLPMVGQSGLLHKERTS